MSEPLSRIRDQARQMARQCNLEFYRRFAAEQKLSREIFFSHPLILRLRDDVLPFLNDGFGHGIEHAKMVALDAGVLAVVETREWHRPEESRRMCILAQMSGLLHDICRMEGDHARKGSEFVPLILKNYPVSASEVEEISFAVANHEAFKEHEPAPTSRGQILSDALYDADKFRWGPDNFITTLWEICCYEEWSIDEIIRAFPGGMNVIEKISDTFRTRTGRIYGPEFIECGLDLGKRIYRLLREEAEAAD